MSVFGREQTLANVRNGSKTDIRTFLQPQLYDPYRFMENESHEPLSLELLDNDDSDAPDASPSERAARRDGWTPFARRLFLAVLSETGRVTLACDYCRLTKQSAYALRARDPVFAASWDAACELARAPLADALYEKALDGVTDTITKDGEVVAERHRFDSRLSIAVLNRLDKRCDRAAELGSQHLALVRNWDEWLSLVGKGEDRAAQALLDSARHGQFGQLPLAANPTELESEDDEIDLSDRCWKDEAEGVWLTDFPPPEGFDGWQSGEWGERSYERECTAEEIALLDADAEAACAAERSEDEELRDAWFAMLKSELEGAELTGTPARHPELDSGSMNTAGDQCHKTESMDPDFRQDDRERSLDSGSMNTASEE